MLARLASCRQSFFLSAWARVKAQGFHQAWVTPKNLGRFSAAATRTSRLTTLNIASRKFWLPCVLAVSAFVVSVVQMTPGDRGWGEGIFFNGLLANGVNAHKKITDLWQLRTARTNSLSSSGVVLAIHHDR
jgi:hypothetical protein